LAVNVTIRRAASLAWLLIGLLSVAACAGRETVVTTYTLPPRNAPSWVGVRVEDVVRLWGEPAERAPDGEGGTVLTYRGKPVARVAMSGDERGGRRNPIDPASPYPPGALPPVESEVERAPAAVFHVSRSGVVYRYTIDSSVLMGGKAPEPPPAGRPDAPPGDRD
jgi:hypothetical protein